MSQERLEMPIDKTEIIIPSLTEDTDPLVFSFIKQPESTINELSKKYFAPDPDFFINTEELKKDPIKAAALVRPTEKTYEMDPVINENNIARNAILAASKIKTAQDNLSSLPEKQKENFEGIKENFFASAAFILSSKKIRNPLIALTTMAGMISGCKSADINLTPEVLSEPTAVTQTNEVTQEATSVPTPTRPDFEGGAGGPYTSEQIQKITNGEFADQENTFKNWMQYWGAAENRPFHPETKDLHYKYLFDGEGNCFVLLEASGDGYEGKLFALPIRDGRFMAVPPETPEGEFEIPEGFGPLMLTGSVAYRDGGLVRLDGDGSVSERLNMETARWEEPKIKVETDPSNPETFPTVTLNDFESGEILAAEREYLETHNPFTGNEIWPKEFKIFSIGDKVYQFIDFDLNNVPAMEGYRNNPGTIPAKTMFYYEVDLPNDYFPVIVIEEEHPPYDFNQETYFLVGEVWLNPDWTENDPASDRYRILHYLIMDSAFRPIPGDAASTYLPVPVSAFDSRLYNDNYVNQGIHDIQLDVISYVYEKYYDDEFPKKYIEEWAETGRIPAELENYVLACQPERFN